MTLTEKQRTALARMSDGVWRWGHEMECPPVVLASLHRRGLIRGADGGIFGIVDECWTITPDGMRALEETA